MCNMSLSFDSITGFGVALAFIVSQTGGIDVDVSSIGSPKTNVTVAMTNNNSPTIRQTLSVTNSAINTNNDGDTINQTNTVVVTNSNSGKRRKRSIRRRAISDQPIEPTSTQTTTAVLPSATASSDH